MSDHSPKKRKRTVPKTITEKTDHEVMESIFGKRVMREVDKITPPLVPENRDGSKNIGGS